MGSSSLKARLQFTLDQLKGATSRSTDGSAPRTAAITTQLGNADRQTPIAAG